MNLALALTYSVLLDGEPIGSHRFELRKAGDQRQLVSSASFDVKVLGIPVYRYRHEAIEQWQGDCLVKIDARTDDGGALTTVKAAPERCVMSFAYWNPRILKQKELLNAQTGQLDPIAVTELGEGRYRISGTKHPIELTYSASGKWIALDSTLQGGRRLSYRLQ